MLRCITNLNKKIFKISNSRQCSGVNFAFLSNTVPVNVNAPELSSERKITKDLIDHLEKLSLVDFGDERGIKIVEDAISFADQLENVNTDGIEPLYSVLENESLCLREDIVENDICLKDLLSHSEKTFEDYYITPSGNTNFHN